jgi:hypothetical protein
MSVTWKDLAQDVGKAAPIIGTLLGGPAGAAVGGLVSAALGCENTPDAAQAAIQADPQAAEKLAEAQLNAKVELQRLTAQSAQAQMANDLAVFQAEVADRASARSMQNAPDWWIRPLIVVMLIIGATAILILLFLPGTRDVIKDPTATGLIGMVIGYWFNELKASMAYYFGATKNADDTAKKIAAFAVSPGTVTSGDAAQ